ncbi:hypothetical protein L596_014736 [Steinernema carpocapsae]|uniref:LEM domain-containing protein n=1 Tax=Steinernema carpocapsae TaxID=34508 RepID=A0A4U5NCR7_STECR|nr:hypothetical protein L596_014736 [Steinernema carpocapsae]
MADIAALSDAELRKELGSLGYNSGAVTGTTRKLYEKKLLKLRAEVKGEAPKSAKPVGKVSARPSSAGRPATRASNERVVERTPPAAPETPVSNATYSKTRTITTTVSQERTPTPTRASAALPTRLGTSASNSLTARFDELSDASDRETVFRDIAKSSPVVSKPSPPSSSWASAERTSSVLPDYSFSNNFSKVRTNVYQDRTPTPPRAPAGGLLSSKFGSSASKDFILRDRFNKLGDTSGDETDDGHTESCRTIDPTPTRLKNIKYGQPTRQLTHFKINPPTPTSIFQRVFGNAKSADSYQQRFRLDSQRQNSSGFWESASKYLLLAFFIIALAYVITHINPNTIYAAKDAVVFMANFTYAYAVVPAISIIAIVGICTGLYYLYMREQNKKTQDQRLFTELVDKITELIREADRLDGIAEPHVRDILPAVAATAK